MNATKRATPPSVSVCAFCGHPDSRHRVVDAILDRVAAGEPLVDVLADYGLSVDGFRQMGHEVRKEVR